MKTVDVSHTTLDACILSAQFDRIVLTRDGHPVALVVGLEGMDEEQVALGMSDKFWKMIQERRGQPTYSRAELEQKLKERDLADGAG